MSNIKVRYGPSPTGIPHIGNIRTALFNFLFAKSQGGEFYLRIEDTDRARLVENSVEKIKESLNLLNIKWDGEVIFQSQRLNIYKKHLEYLKQKKVVYEDEGAWRFRIDSRREQMSWKDTVHGEISFPTNVLEDFIIVKSDGFPTYHFASVVDDHEMKITHVFRGDEWISSTPKHLQLYEAFGWEPPKFVHLPIILGPDKKKLSKREGAKSVMEFIEDGYLPEAILNFLALLGWAPKSNQEVFSLEELVEEFSLERINKNSPVFNLDKLDWFNGQWIRKTPNTKLRELFKNETGITEDEKILEIINITKDRMKKISDFNTISKFFFKKPNINTHKNKITVSKNILEHLNSNLKKIDKWDELSIATVVNKILEEKQLTKPELYRSIGIAISGQLITPPIFKSLEILGKLETVERIENAAEKI